MKHIILILGVFMLLAGSSCKSTRHIQSAVAKIDTVITADETLVPPLETFDSVAFIREQYRLLTNNFVDYQSFSAKTDVDYYDSDGKKYDVTAHIRMQKDSVIWISVTAALGIEGLRVLINKDSVKILDKQNKVYTKRSFNYIQEVTALPLNLSALQDLIIGNPVLFDSSIVSFHRTGENISLLCLGQVFKHMLTISEQGSLAQSSKIDDMDGMRSRTCHLTYADYDNKKGVPFATKRSILVQEKNKLDIRLAFKQYEFNEKLSFPFSVPKNYKLN